MYRDFEKFDAHASPSKTEVSRALTELEFKDFENRIDKLKEQLQGKNSLRLEPEEAEQFFVEHGLARKASEEISVPLLEYDRMDQLARRVWKLRSEANGEPKDVVATEHENLEISENSRRRYFRYCPNPGQLLECVYNKDNEDRSEHFGPRYEVARLYFDLDELVRDFKRSGRDSTIRLVESVLASEQKASRFVDDFLA